MVQFYQMVVLSQPWKSAVSPFDLVFRVVVLQNITAESKCRNTLTAIYIFRLFIYLTLLSDLLL